uniref:Uncharacterized protein n=1 Tax=Magnetococcus massalia (strain MO-1) TaxID=451514 RepID=A0A1S7LK46_MAGMO|nr:Conserved protein of unknown function [Candidatus Magnetococcus massalia]
MRETLDEQDNEETEVDALLSRGLDADLDRFEMRRLYRLTSRDPEIPKRMGTMAEAEDALNDLGRSVAQEQPELDIAQHVVKSLANDPEARMRADQAPHPVLLLWRWLSRAHRMHFQPLSFGSGLVAASVALLMMQSQPVVEQVLPGMQSPRLEVSDIAFKQVEARVKWTSRFILLPGQGTRVALHERIKSSVVLQLESMEPVAVKLAHSTTGLGRGLARELVVDGIRLVTLRDPRAGDQVVVENHGDAPVVVHTRSKGAETAIIESDGQQAARPTKL